MTLALLLTLPLITAVLCRLVGDLRAAEIINVVGAGGLLVVAAALVTQVIRDGWQTGLHNLLYVDALSAIMVAVIAGVGFVAALVSVGYLRRDLAARHVPGGWRGVAWYYLGLHAFIWTMLVTVTVNNLGLLWVGIEATTLASALLVGFYRTRAALEAAWKYLILCTVGITFALFGVLLTYYAAAQTGGGASSLNWTSLMRTGSTLDPDMLRVAFVFVLVGFGTKAGFAPLHAWLADAHSQAPSPVSGLLSGVLLPCALYGILRFHMVSMLALGPHFSSRLLLAFGVLSVLVAAPFMLVQRDIKRLLAYSSVEHIGLMAVAFGIGTPAAVYAGLLHLVNHAASKALLFFVAGDVAQRHGTRRISAIRGLLRVAPYGGTLLLVGVLAIGGVPPFSVFISELSIVAAGFRSDRWALGAVCVVVLLLGAIFAGLLWQALRVLYGAPGAAPEAGRRDASLALCVAPLLAVMLLLGVYVPHPISDLFSELATVMAGVNGVVRL
jgi:hydrogenase-4 component F